VHLESTLGIVAIFRQLLVSRDAGDVKGVEAIVVVKDLLAAKAKAISAAPVAAGCKL